MRLQNFTLGKTIGQRSFSANFKDIFDNFGVCEGVPVWVLAYLFSAGCKELYEMCTANEMKTGA